MSVQRLHAFVDECGTPGFSDVWALGAVVVPESDLELLRRDCSSLSRRVHGKGRELPLKFNVRAARHRQAMVDLIGKQRALSVISVITNDSEAMDAPSGKGSRNETQLVSLQYMLERISWVAAAFGVPVRVTIDPWGGLTSRLADDWLTELSVRRTSVAWNHLDRVEFKSDDEEQLLGLADIVAGATVRTIRPGEKAIWMLAFAELIYRRPGGCERRACDFGCLAGYGLKCRPRDLSAHPELASLLPALHATSPGTWVPGLVSRIEPGQKLS